MRKKGGAESASLAPISLREEVTGKIQTKAASSTKSKLRFEHLKNLTVWATTRDPLIPSLAAFYGHQLAALGEATGIPPDPSLITCQRCETVLQPGFNSTVRIEKNKSKVRHRHKKSGKITQNNVVYKCHYCLHHNLKRGTPKGHIKGIHPSKDKLMLESTPPSKPISRESSRLEKGTESKDEGNGIDVFASRVVAKGDTNKGDGLATPSSTNTTTLLEGEKRRRNSSSSNKAIDTPNMSVKEVAKTVSSTSKKRRKSWTSLKEIAQSKEHENSQISNFTIPFFL